MKTEKAKRGKREKKGDAPDPGEALCILKAFSNGREREIRDAVSPGSRQMDFRVRIRGELTVGPDTEYENWAAVCPWRTLQFLAAGLPTGQVRKAMKSALENRDLPPEETDWLKRLAEAVCRAHGTPILKKRKGAAVFRGIVEKIG